MKWTGILIVMTAGILSVIYLGLCRHSLPIPAEWQTIHRGEPRTEVLARVPNLSTRLMGIKQFDESWRFYHSPVFGHVEQYLIVRYDTWEPQKAHVTQIEVKTLTERYDLLRNHLYQPVAP
ncbi:MAG: hypothetical protein QM796_12995 [Chthoniobacteraceae bacterium]